MKLGWVSCLASIDRVTLADRTTFPHIINTLACLTGPILGKKKNGHINKVKINSAKPIVKFNKKISRHSVRVINNQAGSTLTWPTWTTFSHIKLMLCKVSSGGGQRHINGV